MVLDDLLDKGVLVFDGAMGTLLQSAGLPAGMCPDAWCLANPDAVASAHRQYVEAGAQVVETNTFGATPIRLAHYGLADKVLEINRAAVRVARDAAQGAALVAGSIGPLGILVEPLGGLTFDQAYEQFAAQVKAFAGAKPDFLIIETIADLNEMRAAILACKDHAPGIPIIAQMTVDPRGRSYTGTTPESAALVMQSMGADAMGLNCSVGPDILVEAVARIRDVARIPISVQPNAGLPRLVQGKTVFPMGPEEFASYGPRLVAAGASIVGGCCGTTPEHIRLLQSAVQGLKAPSASAARAAGPLSHCLGLTSRTQSLFFTDDRLPVVIGERINPTGRKALSKDIKDGVFEMVRREAKRQVTAGAQALDVNVGVPLIDEPAAMKRAVQVVQETVSVPVSIDSVSPEAIEAGLRAFSGKALINSVTAEESKAEKIMPLAKRYGAALIGLAMDGDGLPSSADDRVRIARKLLDMAKSYGIPPWDVVIDPLALTAGAQQAQAVETLRSIAAIKDLGCLTSLGISNVSFGLPNRGFLNSVYLSMALAAGLDMAIVNPLDERMADTVRAVRVFLNRDKDSKEFIRIVGPKRLVHNAEEAVEKMGGAGGKPGAGEEAGRTAQSETGAEPVRRAEPLECAAPLERAEPAGRGDPVGRAELAEPLERVEPKSGAESRRASPATETLSAQVQSLGRSLYDAVLEGHKDGIVPLLDAALAGGLGPMRALDGFLIPAITETGRLFADGVYFLPQLMLSASAMKAAFQRLKPELAKESSGVPERGTVVMATVQGDVHDIGKNIVSIMLENHGFRVVDLGRDVSSEHILSEARKVRADVVCLSALMTTTMPRMKEVIDLFGQEGFACPVVIGGAATTKAFAQEIGAKGYGRDAQEAVLEVLRLVPLRGLR